MIGQEGPVDLSARHSIPIRVTITMRRIAATLAVVGALLFSAGFAWADWDDGVAAYNRGDFATALQEWRPLAEQGHALAQQYLGNMYATGRGVPENDAEAVKWYRKAAEQGYAGAQYWLRIHVGQNWRGTNLVRCAGNRPPRSRQASKPPAPSASKQQRELERLRRENARLKKEKQAKPKKVAKKPKPSPKKGSAESGFFISKAGHVITNQHVVGHPRPARPPARLRRRGPDRPSWCLALSA